MNNAFKIVSWPFLGLWKLNMLLGRLCSKLPAFGKFVHFVVVGHLLFFVIVIFTMMGFRQETAIIRLFWFGFILSVASPFFARKIYRNADEDKRGDTYGKARYSRDEELKDKGLISNNGGIVYGLKSGKFVEKGPDLPGHTVVIGPPGSGKTAAMAIPTLLRWPGAAFAIDIKGELSDLTAHTRENVYIFDPEKGGGHCYDPLNMARDLASAQDLARTIIPLPQSGEGYWALGAQGIFGAAILEAAKLRDRTFQEVCQRCCVTPGESLVSELMNSTVKEVQILASLGDTNEKALQGVISEMRTHLITLAADESIGKATSRSDWTPAVFEDGATVYLRVSEHLLNQYSGLWGVIVAQILRYLSRRPEHSKPGVLLLIDELARIGTIDGLPNAMATLRSRNVHIVGIIQSLSQLDKNYGTDTRKEIMDMCTYQLVLATQDPETQEYFSKLAGQRTTHSKSVSAGSGGWIPNISKSETGAYLIRPEEWRNLPGPILFAPKLMPTLLKPAYWKNIPSLQRRVG